MPHFKAALKKKASLLIAQISQLEQKILDWEKLSVEQKKIVSNLYGEHFTSISEMERFIDEVLPFIQLPAAAFKNKVFQIYTKYIFTGNAANIDISVSTFGFSLTKYILREVINRDYLDYFTQDASEVDVFLANKTIGLKDDLLDFMLIKGSPSILWVTWSESSNDPFDFLKHHKREEVYNALALSSYYRDTPIFIFKIDRTRIVNKSLLIRPTVFDANNYPSFLPVELSFKDYGYTDPHNDPALLINNIPLHHQKRPEAIIDGSTVSYADIHFAKEL